MTKCDGPNKHLKENYSEEGAHHTHDFEQFIKWKVKHQF